MTSVLAVVTARGGSKGLPGKNLRPLAGKPLIAWTVEAALGAACIDRVIVSTDSLKIAEVAVQYGAEVPFLRSPELATDAASSVAVLIDAVRRCPGHEFCVLVQPTSPLLMAADLETAFERLNSTGADACVAVCQAMELPWLMYGVDEKGWLEPVVPPWPGGMRRQDMPPVYLLNGAFYFIRCSTLLHEQRLLTQHCTCHVMPRARSVDIDTQADFDQAENYLVTSVA